MKRAAALALLLGPAPLLAHGGAHQLHPEPPGWTLDPSVTVPLLIAVCLYAIGLARLWARSEGGRGAHRRHALLFAGGWLMLAGAVVSPLHEAGEKSFTLHMIEHELIMVGAALLLAVSRPLVAMLWALPSGVRQTFGRAGRSYVVGGAWGFVSHPLTATVLQAGMLILWHAPPLFNRALAQESWHVAQHLSFLISALIFWWAMTRRDGGYVLAAMCLFATSLIGGVLGALMAFAASPWYAGYVAMGMAPFGLSPIEDQQLAGMVMWVPGGMIHAGAALVLLARALRSREARHAVAFD